MCTKTTDLALSSLGVIHHLGKRTQNRTIKMMQCPAAETLPGKAIVTSNADKKKALLESSLTRLTNGNAMPISQKLPMRYQS